jgi:SagB-type dehydrogenase family enzyme
MRIRYILNVALLVAAVAVSVTGFLVDQLDLNDFAPHRWAGYAVAVLIAIHVGQRWRSLLPPGRRAHRAPRAPQPMSSAAAEHGAAAPPVGSPGTSDHGPGPRPPHPSRRSALRALGAGAAGVVVGWSARGVASPDPYDGGDVGAFYHRQSSLGVRGLVSDLVDWGREPARYQRVGDEPSVPLPAWGERPMSLAQALGQRRSLREFADRDLTAEELAWVVHAATAITSAQGLRTAPSAGGLFPLETYVAVERVDGLAQGLYHVDVRAQALEPVRRGSVSTELMLAGLGQDFLRRAPAVLVVTGLFQRSRWKYRQRHYRYVCWEGGHVAQNVYLAAEAAGLGACMVGAFHDGMLNGLIGVDGRQEAALGLITVGPR